MGSTRIHVGVGGAAVADSEAVIVSIGLGSCVALILHDRRSGIGGLAHVVLPRSSEARSGLAGCQFADTAVRALREELESRGVTASRLVAKLVGGARMYVDPNVVVERRVSMGSENLKILRSALQEEGISIVGEDVGGSHGRSVEFHVGPGTVFISAVGRDPRKI